MEYYSWHVLFASQFQFSTPSFSLFPRVSPHSIMSVFGPDGGWSSPHKIPFHCLGSGISRLPKGLAGKVQPEPCFLIWWFDELAHGVWPTFGFDLRLLFFSLFLWMTPLSFIWHLPLHSCMALTDSKQSLLPREVVLSISKKEFQ